MEFRNALSSEYIAILRTVLGALMGIAYGLLVGAVTFQLLQLTYDPRYPGPMIPDANGWARIITLFATAITGFCGALVGMVVGLVRVNSVRLAVIGFAFGLGVFVMLTVLDFAGLWSSLIRQPAHVATLLLAHLAMYFVAFPLGLALVGLVTGFITRKLKL